MSSFLLDTCVLFELVRVKPDSHVISWLSQQSEESLFISVLSVGEIEKGIEKCPDDKRRIVLRAWLDQDLKNRFQRRLLPVSQEIATRWGRLLGEAECSGKPLPVIDALLAATARNHGLTLATRNLRDFQRCSVSLFNPWEFESD